MTGVICFCVIVNAEAASGKTSQGWSESCLKGRVTEWRWAQEWDGDFVI